MKATPLEVMAIDKVLALLDVTECKCIRCTNPMMQPLMQPGDPLMPSADDEEPHDEDPVPMQISKMKLQLATLEASDEISGDAVLSCLKLS